MLRRRGWTAILGLCVVMACAGCREFWLDVGVIEPGPDSGPMELPRPEEDVPRIREYAPANLDSVKEAMYDNAKLWRTLRARCTVRLRSPRIRNTRGQNRNMVELRDVELLVFKAPPIARMADVPSMVKVSLRSGEDLVLVSNGQDYYVSIPRLGQEYYGQVGQPPSSGRPRDQLPVLPVRPQDVGEGIEPWAAFWNCLQVIKQDIGAVGAGNRMLEIVSLELANAPEGTIREGQPSGGRIQVANNLVLDRQTERPLTLFKYGAQQAPRAIVVYREFQEHDYSIRSGGQTKPGPPVTLPQEIWIGYPETSSSMLVRLDEVRVNVPVAPERFDLVETEQ